MYSLIGLCLLLFLFDVRSIVGQESVDIDAFGETIRGGQGTRKKAVNARRQNSDGSVSATFSNLFMNESIQVFWQAEQQENDVLIVSIDPSRDAVVTTFLGHTFYALLSSDLVTRAYPGSVTIGDGEDLTYAFGPDPPAWSKVRQSK